MTLTINNQPLVELSITLDCDYLKDDGAKHSKALESLFGPGNLRFRSGSTVLEFIRPASFAIGGLKSLYEHSYGDQLLVGDEVVTCGSILFENGDRIGKWNFENKLDLQQAIAGIEKNQLLISYETLLDNHLVKNVLAHLDKISVTGYDITVSEEVQTVNLIWKRKAIMNIDAEMRELFVTKNADKITNESYSESEISIACNTIKEFIN